MDTIGEVTRRIKMIEAREQEDTLRWDFEETMLQINGKSWSQKQRLLTSAEQNQTHTDEFLRNWKDMVSRQSEEHSRNWRDFMSRKEKSLEVHVHLKLQEICLLKSSLGSEGVSAHQLVPGIPDEITLDKITTKLSWREIHVLKSVSRGWYNAIQNDVVHDARVRSHVTETFFLVKYSTGLRCLRDYSRFDLPPISYHNGKGLWPSHDRCVVVDGKVYVLGGLFYGPSDKVYMLALAGQRRWWTEVASMHRERANFSFGVMDGKIYVFGGTYLESHLMQYLCECEVYDPKKNKWSLIAPKCSFSCHGTVAIVGEEFYVYDPCLIKEHAYLQQTNILEIYHPAKDEWRKLEPFAGPDFDGTLFVLKGKVYAMDDHGICVHNFDENSWTQVCSHSLTPIIGGFDCRICVLTVEDHLLAFGFFADPASGKERTCVLRSIGFDPEKEKLEWVEDIGWDDHDEIVTAVCLIDL